MWTDRGETLWERSRSNPKNNSCFILVTLGEWEILKIIGRTYSCFSLPFRLQCNLMGSIPVLCKQKFSPVWPKNDTVNLRVISIKHLVCQVSEHLPILDESRRLDLWCGPVWPFLCSFVPLCSPSMPAALSTVWSQKRLLSKLVYKCRD